MNKYILGFFLLIATTVLAQQATIVDFQRLVAQVQPDPGTESVSGSVEVSFVMLEDASSVYLDGVNMEITSNESSDLEVASRDNKIYLTGDFKSNARYTAKFSYKATPGQTLYFTGDQIWTQGQGKYTSHWLPSLDDMNDKLEFDLTVIAAEGQTVIANGKLVNVEKREKTRAWAFDMKEPMSSYLVALAIGDYKMTSFFTKSNKKIALYYRPEDSERVEPTYRYTREIFEFLEEEIGVPYPWQNYKQVPVRDFLYAGMENTTATIFSEAFVVDSIGFTDRNYVNVNAHELAHQWFGNLVTEISGEHHWLQEGFATYYALLAERELFGEDYYYWKLYQTAEQLKELSDSGKGESLLNPKASSLTFYEKGAWALHILRERVGDNAFRLAVQTYLEKHRFENVETDDFLSEVEAASGKSMQSFRRDWLEQSAFKGEQAYESLIKSEFMQSYFEVSALRSTALGDKEFVLKNALIRPNDFIGQEAVYQLLDEPIAETLDLYKTALESGNLYVRQTVASTMSRIPQELKELYETLLDDASYVTQEAALYNLWINFPEERESLLTKMEDRVGFKNKNIRQL